MYICFNCLISETIEFISSLFSRSPCILSLAQVSYTLLLLYSFLIISSQEWNNKFKYQGSSKNSIVFLKNSTYQNELLDFLYTYIFLDSFLIDCSVENLFFLLMYKLFSCSFSNSLKLSYTRKKPWKFICPLTHLFSNDQPCKRQEVLDHELFTDSNSRNNLQRGMAGKG